ncbi:FAD binding domain-containing protein [Sphaerochaeta halotolerans]|jgi:carbon-monoxide dehydrogenase medium subunit|uniref:Molybdopterin dehydrogenase n=1 Tax=Sphaerochaeta halotolerans TaxID=2293840 RepID=A0A372MI37_9SPIR|nr:FAD binding domain-containing protein [Sphaerochaeta halotolerans]MBG0766814.1 FAD binding domain-containing protein [Spirochaetaceae bacterium]MDK2859951.1 aerobic carbon-monoxide dehydrogenase medium subunit [Sphaerochaeta sp.]MXI86558.1 molybdopterin dehydrogenase [Sphaerochaeta halotolerans]RFU94996.1 molybdopterin dehydrogenase [Sphaerochaeta halotolerans]
MIHQFSYMAPTELDDLLALLDTTKGGFKLLAGGTDLLVNIRNGLLKPDLVIDVKRIAGAGAITYDVEKGLQLGWATTINDIISSTEIAKHYPLLQACACDLASYQVRNRATVVGNIVNASPCSDMAPALLCLDASILVATATTRKTIPIQKFFTGVKQTVLQPREMVVGITIPSHTKDSKGVYRKLKRIQGHDLGIVGVAVAMVEGRLRIAVSSAAPTPVITDDLPLDVSAPDALYAVERIINPISDIRCTKEYRRFMVSEFTKRLIQEVRA